MLEVYISEHATKELLAAYRWYKAQDIAAAAKLKESFRRALRSIARQPLSFPHEDPIHRFYLLQRYPYKVIYRVYEDRISIVAVVHTSREPDAWRER